jgi:hypothetical protein
MCGDPHAAIGHFSDEAVPHSALAGNHSSEIFDALARPAASFLAHVAAVSVCRGLPTVNTYPPAIARGLTGVLKFTEHLI